MKKVGFIGLGNMGFPMASNLLSDDVQLSVFDLQAEPVEELVKLGANKATTPEQLCAGADVVITMLPAGEHVKGLYLGTNNNGLFKNADKSTLFIDCSTIDSESAITVHSAAKKQGLHFLDAPVSGGVAAAQAGTLTFMCGGQKNNFETAKETLKYMGVNIFHAGKEGAGQVAKMCNNMLLAIHMIGTSEALKLGETNGLNAKTLSEIMLASSGKNWSLEKYNPYPGVNESVPASNEYRPGFMVDLMTKDLNLAIDNAKAKSSQTPLGEKALELYSKKQAMGDGKMDFSSIIQILG